MNKAKFKKAQMALWRLEREQFRFNDAIMALSDEDLVVWVDENVTALEESTAKNRIKAILEAKQSNDNNPMKEAPIEDAVTNPPVLLRRTAVSGAVVKMAKTDPTDTSGKASTLDNNNKTEVKTQ